MIGRALQRNSDVWSSYAKELQRSVKCSKGNAKYRIVRQRHSFAMHGKGAALNSFVAKRQGMEVIGKERSLLCNAKGDAENSKA